MKTFYWTALRLLLLTLLSTPMVGRAQGVAWAHKLEKTNTNENWYYLTSHHSQTDAAGNTYVAGRFTGTVRLGDSTLTAPGGGTTPAFYVARFDANGVLQWVVLGATRPTYGQFIPLALTLNDDAAPILGITDGFQIGGQPLANAGIYLITLTTTGQIQQIVQPTIPLLPPGQYLGLERIAFGGGRLFLFASTGNYAGQLTCLTSAGQVVWSRLLNRVGGCLEFFSVLTLSASPNGDVSLALTTEGVCDARTDSTGSAVRISSGGGIRWNRDGSYLPGLNPTVYGEAVTAFAYDQSGNTYALVHRFDNQQHYLSCDRFSATGQRVWRRDVLLHAGTLDTWNDRVQDALTVTPTGEIAVLTTYRDAAQAGPFTLPRADSLDLALLHLDAATGTVLSAERLGGSRNEYGTGHLGHDQQGNLYFSGQSTSPDALGGRLNATAPRRQGHFFLARFHRAAARPDVHLTLTALGPARRGTPVQYRAQIENVGTAAATGPLTVWLPAALTNVAAVPPPDHQTGTSLAWDVTALAPGAVRTFTLSGLLPLALPLGTALQVRAALPLPDDLTLTDNADSVAQGAVGPVLTASLTVDRDTLTLAQVAAGTPLTYQIRFQNVGTDTAFALSVRDSLPAGWLQMGTLNLLAASHNCRWALDSAGQLQVLLADGGLPDSTTNRLASKGFLRFRVTPRTTLVAGTRIRNTAHLTCTGSTPASTNEVFTLVLGAPTGLPHEPGTGAFTLYPNPATETVTLTGAEAGGTITVFDALGRAVRHAKPETRTAHLDLRGLPPGLYVVRVGNRTQRLVVE